MPTLLGGTFSLRGHRPDGAVAWQCDLANTATFDGLHYLLRRGFADGPARPVLGVGLILAGGFAGTSTADTAADHPGWVLFPDGSRPLHRVETAGATSGQMAIAPAAGASIDLSGLGEVPVRGVAFFAGLTAGAGGTVSVGSEAVLVATAVYRGTVTGSHPAPYGLPLVLSASAFPGGVTVTYHLRALAV